MKTICKETLSTMELYNSNDVKFCSRCSRDIRPGEKYASTTGHANYGTHLCYTCWLDAEAK
jgi:hypothetical protein